MYRIATLGPVGTFTEIASKEYIKRTNIDAEICFYPNIQNTFHAIGKECDIGIIPIENTLDGYVEYSLDLLLHTDLKILNEIVLPIHFKFVSNIKEMDRIEKIYVQFKTQGQCVKFLNKFDENNIVTTASNGKSYDEIKSKCTNEAAIIPSHIDTEKDNFEIVIDNIEDFESNQTRFLIIGKDKISYKPGEIHKTSLIIVDAADEPGILSKILNEFADKSINLKSIISRPTKRDLGKYHFFIDIEGNFYEDKKIQDAVNNISEKNVVKVLGSYSVI